jgi:hypothetical protein
MTSLSLETGTKVSMRAVRDLAAQIIPEELAVHQFRDLVS